MNLIMTFELYAKHNIIIYSENKICFSQYILNI